MGRVQDWITDTSMPANAAHLPVVVVDVRADLRAGREPLRAILTAVDSLAPTEMLQVRATFAPLPLLELLANRGFVHHLEQFADDDWSVWFWCPA